MDHYDGETVVLDPFVREAILLEVPNFPLCSEDCAGIQPAAPTPPPSASPATGTLKQNSSPAPLATGGQGTI